MSDERKAIFVILAIILCFALAVGYVQVREDMKDFAQRYENRLVYQVQLKVTEQFRKEMDERIRKIEPFGMGTPNNCDSGDRK